MNNQIQIINQNIEKSNIILKKFKLLYQNNNEITNIKTVQVVEQLTEHLTKVYNFSKKDFYELIKNYKTDKETIKNLGGTEIANYISTCLENYLNTQGN